MRENEMREALRALCEDLDRRRRTVLGAALGAAALALTACSPASPPAAGADAGVERRDATRAGDAHPDIPSAVAVYSAPGCSWVPPGSGR